MIIILDNIRSAYNVGSIIRSAEAFGVKEIFFCGITPDPNNPKVKKTSLGAEKYIKTCCEPDIISVIENLRKTGYKIFGLETDPDSISINKLKKVPPKLVVVLGNEISGISDSVLELCHKVISIPMDGKKESLNVSIAASIALFALRYLLRRD